MKATVEISTTEYAALVNLVGVSGALLDGIREDLRARANDGFDAIGEICSRFGAQKRERHEAREKRQAREHDTLRRLGVPPLPAIVHNDDGTTNFDAIVTVRFRKRTRTCWSDFVIEEMSLLEARCAVVAYREILVDRATERDAMQHTYASIDFMDTFELTRPGERVVISVAGTLSQIHTCGFV